MSTNSSVPENHENDELAPNSAADEFFVKMKHDFRRPKPSQEAIAAAMQAMQNLMSGSIAEKAADEARFLVGETCPKCGAANTEANRFCGYCGALLKTPANRPSTAEPETSNAAQHIYHHHYHYFSQPENKSREPRARIESKPATPEIALTEAAEPPDEEKAIHKLVRDWCLQFNSKRTEELADLYSSDAIVLRPSALAAHGNDSIRELFEASLKEGLGEVDLECAEIGVAGDFACITGHSKMLVPITTGKREEQTGKYLIVARRYAGEWKIIADSWCMDPVSVKAPAANAAVLPIRAAVK